MKRIWKRTASLGKASRQDEAVSPVIATILMVAITVVLAAVLYVLVIGLVDGPPDTPPVGTWTSVDAESSTQGTLAFGTFSYEVKTLEIRLIVKANGTEIGQITIPSNDGTAPLDATWTNAPEGATATYYDYSPESPIINQGDYITLSGLSPGTSYSFEVYHLPSQGICAMTGENSHFSTP